MRYGLMLVAVVIGGLAGCGKAQEPVWVEASTLTVEGQGWPVDQLGATYVRLPAKAQGVVPDGVWGLAQNSTGISVRFVTTSPQLKLAWRLNTDRMSMAHMPATGMSGIDVYAKQDGVWRFVNNGQPRARDNEVNINLPAAEEYRLYLPLYNGVETVRLAANEGHTISPAPVNDRPLVMFYGTSILQGGCASRPGLAAVSIAGRALNVPTINLGFSGAGQGEPEVADLLAEIDADIFVLDPLWNMQPAQMQERYKPMVRKIRAAHPDAPILLVEDTQVHDWVPTTKGKLLREYLAELEAEGITGLYFLDAHGMLGTDGEGTVDGVHPNDIGFMRQAAKYVEALQPIIDSLVD